MILEGIVSLYEQAIDLAKKGTNPKSVEDEFLRELVKKARLGTGNPTGAALGKCAARMQQLRYPALSHPEYIRPRTMMTFEAGDRIEAWFGAVINRAFPNQSGLAQQVFYVPVPIPTAAQVEELRRRIALRWGTPGAIWGKIVTGFVAPTISLVDGRMKYRAAADQMAGFVLDPAASVIYAPTYVDRIFMTPDRAELVVVEKKSCADGTFRRMMVGDVGYDYLCQLAGFHEGTGLDVVLLAYRKMTGHMLEISYSDKVDKTKVTIMLNNKTAETFFVKHGELVGADGRVVEVPDSEWETAQVVTPFRRDLLEAMRTRVLRVLLAEPGEWHREYGPDFVCRRCQGTGTQTLQKGSVEPLKEPKPCTDCGGVLPKKKEGIEAQAGSGQVDETALPYPCNYCQVVMSCYAPAHVRLEIGTYPAYLVRRDDYLASGLSFHPPGLEEVSLAAPDDPAEAA